MTESTQNRMMFSYIAAAVMRECIYVSNRAFCILSTHVNFIPSMDCMPSKVRDEITYFHSQIPSAAPSKVVIGWVISSHTL